MKNIFDIIKKQDFAALKDFLVESPRGLDVEAEDGAWALHELMRQGNLEMVQYVVEYGIVNLNLVDKWGNTVLHYGVESGNMDLIKYLVERVDSPIGQANLLGETPFDKAQRLNKTEIQGYLEEKLGAKAEELYHNPICRGMNPDPSIVRVGDDYYMVNSSFVFFPSIPISHSRDLIHWECIGYAITNPKWARMEKLEGGRGYWAPDISYYEGKFYITATYRLNDGGRVQRLQMVTSSEKPEGPYCEPVFLEEEGIDPSIFTDLDGRRYMLLNRGARIFEISKDGREILSKPKLLWYGDNKKASEGPHLLYKDGYYYLFMAEGGTGMGHRISVARSKTLMGVYESCPYNPILRQWDDKRQLQCCGHGMPVETAKGDWYMVYLCNRPGVTGYALLGRETALDPITWTADGWPLVNNLRGPSDIQKKPAVFCKGETAEQRKEQAQFCPDKGFWREWSTIRGYEAGSFAKQDGEICICGNGTDLHEIAYNRVLLQHQKEFCFEMSCQVRVDVTEEKGDWDCGLTCYYDENSYMKLALCQRAGQIGILAAEYVDNEYITEQFQTLEVFNGQISLKVLTEHLKRSLYVQQNQEWKLVTVLKNTSYLSSEGLHKGKRFTGAAAGIYVNGNITGYFQDFTM